MASDCLQFYRNNLKRKVKEITLNNIRDALDDDDKLFPFLASWTKSGRSFPSRYLLGEFVSPDIVAVLLDVSRNGSVLFDRKNINPAVVHCYKSGFLHAMEPKAGKVVYVLASPLHARFVEYTYGRLDRSFPFEIYPDIRTLGLKILERFSSEILRLTRDGQRLGTSGKVRPPEACFVDEFYRCFLNEVGSGIGICSEWSSDGQGRIDLYVPQVRWGFELIRDADRVKEHCDRFRLAPMNPGEFTPESQTYGEFTFAMIILGFTFSTVKTNNCFENFVWQTGSGNMCITKHERSYV
ncbi:hypothetical protein Egran_02812 [Elaphomyces granulatus]|uniref:Uncharacterized protein n=1 Tax=Elaphomyces granulatus TaxID=519963 RepID=A0A232LZB7_9EURO|nr:hypothetical protein Egran_02812 [Elaphomyces granulatus]